MYSFVKIEGSLTKAIYYILIEGGAQLISKPHEVYEGLVKRLLEALYFVA